MAEEALAAKKRGNQFFVAGNWEDAIKEFTSAIELDSSQHVFFSNRSACHSEMKKFDEALSDAESCIKLKPDWAKGYSRKGCALFGQNKLEESKAAYEEGLKIDPSNAALAQGVKDVDAKLASFNPFASMFGESLWGKIATNPQTSAFLNDPNFVNKVKLLQSNPQVYLNLYMKDPQMMQVIQLAFSEMGLNFQAPPPGEGDQPGSSSTSQAMEDDDDDDDDEGKDDIEVKPKEPEVKPQGPQLSEAAQKEKDASTAKELGNGFYKKRKFDEAIEAYTNAVDLMPDSPVYLTNRSAAYFMKGDLEKSAEDCHSAIKVARKNYAPLKFVAKAFTRLGDISIKQEHHAEAIDYYSKSLLEEGNYSVKKKLKAIEELKAELDRKAYINPELGLVHKENGNKLFQESKWKEAIEEYSESIKRNPSDHKVYSNRAGAYTKLMAWEYALKDCNKCMELEPGFAKAYLRKGKIEHLCKEYQKAIATYNTGLEFEPDSVQLVEAKRATLHAISTANAESGGVPDKERQARALADPEVQKILQDPEVSSVLESMQENPAAAQAALSNPSMRKKLEVLIAAGIIQVR